MGTPLDIIVPVLMGAALLWWIGRGMGGRAMLIATAVTLAVIVAVLLVQNAGWRYRLEVRALASLAGYAHARRRSR